MPLDFTDNNML